VKECEEERHSKWHTAIGQSARQLASEREHGAVAFARSPKCPKLPALRSHFGSERLPHRRWVSEDCSHMIHWKRCRRNTRCCSVSGGRERHAWRQTSQKCAWRRQIRRRNYRFGCVQNAFWSNGRQRWCSIGTASWWVSLSIGLRIPLRPIPFGWLRPTPPAWLRCFGRYHLVDWDCLPQLACGEDLVRRFRLFAAPRNIGHRAEETVKNVFVKI